MYNRVLSGLKKTVGLKKIGGYPQTYQKSTKNPQIWNDNKYPKASKKIFSIGWQLGKPAYAKKWQTSIPHPDLTNEHE